MVCDPPQRVVQCQGLTSARPGHCNTQIWGKHLKQPGPELWGQKTRRASQAHVTQEQANKTGRQTVVSWHHGPDKPLGDLQPEASIQPAETIAPASI